jgi:hypothetical protein
VPLSGGGFLRAHATDGGREVASAIVEVAAPSAPSVRFASPSPDAVTGTEVEVDLVVEGGHERAVLVAVDGDLLGWWSFDDPGDLGADRSGHGRRGVVRGGTPGVGRFAGGLVLDGVDDYVDVGEVGATGGPMTIEGWYRFGRFPIERVSSSGLHSVLYHHPGNEHLYLTGTNEFFRSSSLLTPGAWHHVAVTWADDASTARLFVDGREVEVTVQGEAEPVPTVEPFWIGRSFDFFEGAVDEVRVWGRALSAAEIRAAYDGSRLGHTLVLAPGEHQLTAWVSEVTGAASAASIRVRAR